MTAQHTLAHAALLVSNERWRDAAAVLGPHLASNPDDAQALRLMAQCQLGMDQSRAAADAAARALAIEPDSEWAHRLMSIAHLEQEAFVAARREAEEAIRLDPTAWHAHHLRAQVDVRSKTIDRRTWAAARRALELAPDETAPHIMLGLIALRSRNTKLAAAEFREALRLDPNHAIARNNLAVVQLRRRRLASAGALLSSALRSSPNDELFAANLRRVLRGWALMLNLLALVGCWILFSATDAHRHPISPELAGPSPKITFTFGPTQVVTLPGTSGEPVRYHYTAVTGHPAVLILVAAALAGALVAAAIAIRRSVGSAAGRILLAAMRTDRPLLLTVVSCLSGIVLLCAAAVAGMPIARDLITAAFITNITAGLVNWIVGRKRVAH